MTRHPIGLLVTLALGLLVVPLATGAQQLAKIPRIGHLADSARRAPSETLRPALRKLGFVKGQTIAFEWRLADTPEQYPVLAAERERADALVTLDCVHINNLAPEQIAGLAVQHRLPGIYHWRRFVEAGGLMSYGRNFAGRSADTPGKTHTQKIERKHLTLRTQLKRIVRKTICFSKSMLLQDIVIGLFVNHYEFGMLL